MLQFYEVDLTAINWEKSRPHSFRKACSNQTKRVIESNNLDSMLDMARQLGELALNPRLSAEHRRHALNSLKRLRRRVTERPDFQARQAQKEA